MTKTGVLDAVVFDKSALLVALDDVEVDVSFRFFALGDIPSLGVGTTSFWGVIDRFVNNSDAGLASVLSLSFDSIDFPDVLTTYGFRIFFFDGEHGVCKTNSTDSSSLLLRSDSALLRIVGLLSLLLILLILVSDKLK